VAAPLETAALELLEIKAVRLTGEYAKLAPRTFPCRTAGAQKRTESGLADRLLQLPMPYRRANSLDPPEGSVKAFAAG